MGDFENIIGHEEIINLLSGALVNKRISHAYLFGGPSGVGKTTLAASFAGALLCSAPGETGACNSCRNCRQFQSGNHPDFFRIVPGGSSIKISQIRELQKKISLEPFQGERQVYIIEEADTMTREAANSFLKCLEEPPGMVVFILVSHIPQYLLPTISSRCQQLNFKPLTGPQVVHGLKRIAGLSEEECRLPAALSGGSLGRAIELTQNSPEREELFNLLDKLYGSSASEICITAYNMAEKEINWQQFMDMLLMWYRDILIYKNTGQEKLIVNVDKIRELKASKLKKHDLLQYMRAIESAKNKLNSRANTRLVLEELFFKLAGI